MMKNFTTNHFVKYLSALLALMGLGNWAMAQCPAGQADITVDITTDQWGYECYWEFTPPGNACGVGTIGAFGNATVVGCGGGGLQVAGAADPGAYPINSTVTENLGCLPIGVCYDIHYVDDWGDGGSSFQFYADGVPDLFIADPGNPFTNGMIGTFCVPNIPPPTPPYDATVDSIWPTEYTILPLTHSINFTMDSRVANVGADTITNVVVNSEVFENVTSVFTTSSTPIAMLDTAASQTAVAAAMFNAATVGPHTFEYIVTIAENDTVPANDTIRYMLAVDDSVMGRDNGMVIGSLGVGAGPGTQGRLGIEVMPTINDSITSITAFIASPTIGDSTKFSVYDFNAGIPNMILDSTAAYVFTATDTNILITLSFATPVAVTAGQQYLVAVHEYDFNVTLGTTSSYQPMRNWVNWTTNPFGTWANNEDFAFNNNYLLRANYGAAPACSPDLTNAAQAICQGDSALLGGGYQMTAGTYNDTLMNVGGCDSVIVTTLTVDALPTVTYTVVTDTVCDSLAAYALTGGTPAGGTYSGTGVTAGMFDPGAAGMGTHTITYMYTDTVTMCSNSAMDAIYVDSCGGGPIGIYELGNGAMIKVAPNPSNGSFNLDVAGMKGKVNVTITDLQGKVVAVRSFNMIGDNGRAALDFNDLPKGVYLMVVSSDDSMKTMRLIFQ